ncbi:hypothetical protein KIN20_025746 [Parelaphostrongylus tenuis]|uniref:Uncharacterized protein n=1 Tax=Parelaphostrongylus tenuis TaxID=148309 RepID=A0AAD5MVS9_PARTN|nr:hypothetical protein KIN20_025746 [Parelaphostrongylus tenuis]
MNGTEANHYDLDDLLFAKFAELDQKVAILREEMDSIAMLLERRKRTRDTSISLASQIIHEMDHFPKWAQHNVWEATVPQQEIQENYEMAFAFALEADRKPGGQLYDADLPAEYDLPIGPSARSANVASGRAIFHPYSRPSSCKRAMSSLNGTMEVPPMPVMLMPDFQGITENEILLDQYDSGEDPPSDPDDNIGAAGSD